MAIWRMAFRCGNQGYDLWPECRDLGLAAIPYEPLECTDLAQYARDEPKELWDQLEASQKGSLRRFAYEIAAGDILYAKSGPAIVGRGRVTGPYQFDQERRLVDPYGTVWAHQVPVEWETDFRPVCVRLGAEQTTVLKLGEERLREIEQAIAADRAAYLLSWNPNRWQWDDIDLCAQDISDQGYTEIRWSCGRTRRIKPGDRLFLLRQGREPRGIFASGWAVSYPYEDEHWDELITTTAVYVEAHLHVLLNPDREPIYPRSDLDDDELAGMHWDTQSSGVTIPPEVASRLEVEWARFLAARNIVPQDALEHRFLPEEVSESQSFVEGATRQISVNAYERNPRAREACIRHHGLRCSVCGFNFEAAYGEIGIGYIQVHHLVPLGEIGGEHELDPIRDLCPICPNCHAMIHRRRPAYTIEEIRQYLGKV